MKKIFFLLLLSISVNAQNKVLPHSNIITPMNSNRIDSFNVKGKSCYSSTSNNIALNGEYIINKTKLNTDIDIVDTYKNTGFKFLGFFNKGYKNKLWKITYKGKIVKTENWNNGLIKGLYKVYNTKGKLLYETNFGVEGNGKYKDFYYKTGVIKQEGNYHNGKKEGEWCNYDTKGKLSKAVFYDQGILIEN